MSLRKQNNNACSEFHKGSVCIQLLCIINSRWGDLFQKLGLVICYSVILTLKSEGSEENIQSYKAL